MLLVDWWPPGIGFFELGGSVVSLLLSTSFSVLPSALTVYWSIPMNDSTTKAFSLLRVTRHVAEDLPTFDDSPFMEVTVEEVNSPSPSASLTYKVILYL